MRRVERQIERPALARALAGCGSARCSSAGTSSQNVAGLFCDWFFSSLRLTTNLTPLLGTAREPRAEDLAAWGDVAICMSYLKLGRTRIILACFLTSSLLLYGFPGVDIQISRIFFDNGFNLKDQWWQTLLREGLVHFLWLSMASVVAVYVLSKLSKRSVCTVNGKKVCYLFLVLLLGAGLIVNVILKDNFGRARPRDIEEFGGSKHFTPAFVVSDECDRNCSFSSGEGAGAFFSLALACALSRRRAIFLAAVGFGSLVSFSRIASGAHFFSDTIVSFFVMLIITDVLYHYMVLPVAEREETPVPRAVPKVAKAKWGFERS